MIKVDNKIKNIYYMLCYSFNRDLLRIKEESNVGDETFKNIYNLLSSILCRMIEQQIKKGIHRDYIGVQEEIGTIKGKINIKETINRSSLMNKKVVCEFDEFSENNRYNQIIKTTCIYLSGSGKVGSVIKSELKRSMLYFGNVGQISLKCINWNRLRFNKYNKSYENILLICELIIKGLIVSDEEGTHKFREFLDETRISTIYENFVRQYYRTHYPEFKASSKVLRFNKDSDDENRYIPTMKTDVTLKYNEKLLIIDAKFYDKIIRNGICGSKVLYSGNLYQILAYVDNQDPLNEGFAYGMLLYAQTVNDPKINRWVNMNGHLIGIRTIDLNAEWKEIEDTLEDIAEWFKDKAK